jgi:sugar/nucleoside kinase (ribokinase family)
VALGDQVALTAPLALDTAGAAVRAEAAALGLHLGACAAPPGSTPRSVLLVDDDGRRQIHTDLADALTTTVTEPRSWSAGSRPTSRSWATST